MAGLSFIEPVCTALNLDPLRTRPPDRRRHRAGGLRGQPIERRRRSTIQDRKVPLNARRIQNRKSLSSSAHTPCPSSLSAFPALAGLSPYVPGVLCQVYSDRVASACKLVLMERYPDEHPVTIVLNAGVPGQEQVIETTLAEMDRRARHQPSGLRLPRLRLNRYSHARVQFARVRDGPPPGAGRLPLGPRADPRLHQAPPPRRSLRGRGRHGRGRPRNLAEKLATCSCRWCSTRSWPYQAEEFTWATWWAISSPS